MQTLHKTFAVTLLELFAEFVPVDGFLDKNLGIEVTECPARFKEIF